MKSIVTVFSILLLSSGVFAQEGLKIGLKGGPQSTWMFNADESDHSESLYVSTVRSVFGLSLGYNFSDGVGVGLDLLMSNEGQRMEVYGVEVFRKLTYFKVPLLLNLNTSSEGTAFGYLNVGPQFGFLTSASTGSSNPFSNLLGEDISEGYKSVNISAVLALGAGFNLTDFLQLTTGLRFDFGLTDAEDKDSVFYIADPTRPSTHTATGALEIGLRYVLRTE